MTHAEMNELYELYVLGALELDEAAEIDQHLTEDCTYCSEHIRDAVYSTSMLSGLAEPVTPSPAVRARLLAGIKGSQADALRPPKRSWLFSTAALIAACLALVVWSWYSSGQVSAMRKNLDSVAAERDQLRMAVQILSRSQTRTIQFGTSDQVTHGRVFVNPSGGFVFVGSDLPQINSDRTFELWLVPAQGAPQPAGLVAANESQSAVHVSQTPVNPSLIKAVAVSVEPASGSSAPTTTPFLVVPLG
jgi:anti-sigma-K factor RskA